MIIYQQARADGARVSFRGLGLFEDNIQKCIQLRILTNAKNPSNGFFCFEFVTVDCWG